jgi:AraC-like DNA-binding protein
MRRIAEDGFEYCRLTASGAGADSAAEIWTMQASTCRTAVEAKLPDPCAELVFNLGPTGRYLVGPDETGPASEPRVAWVIGPHTDVLLVAKEVLDSNVIGVRLRPDAIPQVLGVPAIEVRGLMLDLELFWGSDVDRIRDRLHGAVSSAERAAILEDAIARRARPSAESDRAGFRALRRAIETTPGCSVGRIADQCGLTHRRLIALFDQHVGLKPKQYQQLHRLRRVMYSVITTRGQRSVAGLACELGYVDQAHLANEFRRFTGLTLSQYVHRRSPVGVGVVRHQLAPNESG